MMGSRALRSDPEGFLFRGMGLVSEKRKVKSEK
jgi:hypothetical protein